MPAQTHQEEKMHKIKTSNTAPCEKIESMYSYREFGTGKPFPEKIGGHLPIMGWNSWNAFGTENNEALTKKMADRIVELGLDKLGYTFVVLDDGCYANSRVDGKIVNNEARFPGGFRALADHLHGMGLKFGMYNDVGSKLCSGLEVGTCGYEDTDAKSYADWDIDFLKVDNCYYLWDNATFSNPENARYTFAPNIASITLKGAGKTITVPASEAELTGREAHLTEKGYITGIGTSDGTGPSTNPVGLQSSTAEFTADIECAGEYELSVTYASGREPGVGEWLQISVNDAKEYAVDRLLSPTKGKDCFEEHRVATISLKKGRNAIVLSNHRRQENTLDSYAAMFYALKQYSDKDIILSICEWGKTGPQNWGYKVGNSWRILNDITFNVGHDGYHGGAQWTSDYTNSITSQYNKAVIMQDYAGLARGWNDPDMLVIGMDGIAETQMRTHMVMWCMMNSPLMLGLDLRRVEKGDPIYEIIANKDIIDLNQDRLGVQAKRVKVLFTDRSAELVGDPAYAYVTNNDRVDILYKPLADGDFALSFVNLSDRVQTDLWIDMDGMVPGLGKTVITDLITKETKEHDGGEFVCDRLAPYDSYTIRVRKNA